MTEHSRTCMVCKSRHAIIRYIDLYVFGSEGLNICQPCENEISRMILNLALAKNKERKNAYLETRIKKEVGKK